MSCPPDCQPWSLIALPPSSSSSSLTVITSDLETRQIAKLVKFWVKSEEKSSALGLDKGVLGRQEALGESRGICFYSVIDLELQKLGCQVLNTVAENHVEIRKISPRPVRVCSRLLSVM